MIDPVTYAYVSWRYHCYDSRAADEAIEPFLSISVTSGCALRTARKALWRSVNFMSEKLGISRSAYRQIEAREATGTLTLESLARAAEALDCELIYAIRPKSRKVFSLTVFELLLPIAAKLPSMDTHRYFGRNIPQGLWSAIRRTSYNAAARRQLGFNTRTDGS